MKNMYYNSVFVLIAVLSVGLLVLAAEKNVENSPSRSKRAFEALGKRSENIQEGTGFGDDDSSSESLAFAKKAFEALGKRSSYSGSSRHRSSGKRAFEALGKRNYENEDDYEFLRKMLALSELVRNEELRNKQDKQ